MRIEDISPTGNNTTLKQPASQQSTGGRGLTIAGSRDGRRLYIGNNAGVWRSNDGGKTWKHMERPQPKPGTVAASGALLALNVYDLAVAKDPDIVLACTNSDIRKTNQSGIYRSTDGGANWSLVRQFTETGQIVAAPENAEILFAAFGSALMKSVNSGAAWSKINLPLNGGAVWHVVVGSVAAPTQEATRRIYALGTQLWFSTNGGGTWTVDGASPVTGSKPSDAVGPSTRLIAIHPANPSILYAIKLAAGGGTGFRGDFSGASPVWTALAALPAAPPNTTPSGTEHIVAHVTTEGQLYLFVSDRSALYVSNGDAPASWTRLDAVDFAATGAAIGLMHIDPHAVFVSKDFRLASDGGGRGLIAQVNDGGVQISNDGTHSWIRTTGLTTFSLINVAVNPSSGRAPSITFGTGDNGGFFSSDGGAHWVTAHYQQGDNDACFSDPRQPSLLFVFAPRGGANQLALYTGTGGSTPNAGDGTTQAHMVPGPPKRAGGALGWNCVSSATEIGYRPLILTLPGETPKPGGDFIAIRITNTSRQLVRSTNVAGVSAASDWDSTAVNEGAGSTVFQQGPALPAGDLQIAQASGGHIGPVFYVGDTVGLWKWTAGMPGWLQVVPAAGGPAKAVRFYVDPYRPNRIYLIDSNHAWRSADGGSKWTIDAKLESTLTENGAFPIVAPSVNNTPGRTPFEAQLQDFAFDPSDPQTMFAAGPAGVFMTSDSVNWRVVASAAALNTRVMSIFLDTISDPTTRILYVATPFRGLLKITLTPTGVAAAAASGFAIAQALLFQVFRSAPFPDPFVASPDPGHPDVATPEGKLQKALTDAITAKAGESGHNHVLKTRDPAAADFLDVFPIPFTIADVTAPGRYPVAHYNGDEVDFIASEAKVTVLYAAVELRNMVRRYAQDLGITQASVLLSALDLLAPQIQKAAQLIKDAKDVRGRRVPIKDAQRLPNYGRIFDFDESGGTLKINFKGAIAKETDGRKKQKDYDFGHSLYDMIVNSGDATAKNCIDAIGYAFLNGALEAGGFFERPTPADPKTFRGVWVGGNYAVETIRGEMSVNDGPAQFGGTTRQIAKLFALVHAGTFAEPTDPNGDLMSFLLNAAGGSDAAFPPVLRNYASGSFTYVLNKLGWAQLGIGDPSKNWVASEGALIKTQKADGTTKLYVVAWQNLELHKKRDRTLEVAKAGPHTLYYQADLVDIITKTIAAYQA